MKYYLDYLKMTEDNLYQFYPQSMGKDAGNGHNITEEQQQ
jgi:hypothetical protein